VLPVGGGGLASGVIMGLRESGDHTPVWVAEPEMANDFAESLRAGRIVSHDVEKQTIADGARTRSVGRRNWAILQLGVAGAIEVPEDAIAEGVRVLSYLANVKAEPTGALGIGALLAQPDRFRGARVCCVVSGGNADPALYASLISE
jgi:threo-3-hydroxy-L-aspartate ammonia-lyase